MYVKIIEHCEHMYYIHSFIFIYTCTYSVHTVYIQCTYIRTCIHTYIVITYHTYIHTYIVFKYVCTYIYVNKYIHTFIHSYIHTYIHMHCSIN